MPHLRHERHHGRNEGVLVGNVAMNLEVGALVNSVLRTENEKDEIVLQGRLPNNTNVGIVLLVLIARARIYSLHLRQLLCHFRMHHCFCRFPFL